MKPDPALLAIFETEQREHVERIRALLSPEAGPVAAAALEEAFRRAHTLKGAARAVGLEQTEFLAHRLESLFARAREGALALDRNAAAAVEAVLDGAEDVLACALGKAGSADISPAIAALEALPGMRSPAGEPPAAAPASPAPGTPPPAGGASHEMLRVSAGNVDALVSASSQLLGSVGAQAGLAQQAERHLARVREIAHQWERHEGECVAVLRARRADPQFAPVFEAFQYIRDELRAVSAGAHGLHSGQQRTAWELAQQASGLHARACQVRMTPADTVFGGFRKMVRDLARDEGKEVEFHTEGMDVQADRLVLQALKDPVMHLLRNAISHGIGNPRERAASGKPAAGAISLRLEARGSRLRVSVEDDGKGIDTRRVAEVAVSRGLLTRAAAAAQSPREVMNLILQPGFSTSRDVTRLAGRGIGLAVVQELVTRIQGEVAIEPRAPAGTTVRISVPLTISTQHVLLVGCGAHTFGIPAASIAALARARMEDIEHLDGREVMRDASGPVPLARLSGLLDLPGPGAPAGAVEDGQEESARALPVAVLRSGGERAGLIVDRLVDDRDALVKDLGLPGESSGIALGAIPLEDGAVAVVLNPAALMERFRDPGRRPALKPAAAEPAPEPPSILVVDDSITTRSLEKSILEAHGYRVRVAVDGVEALEELRAAPADLVIADVMMPRMTGLELLQEMKKDQALAAIPVVIVSSLERREDQERGLSLGANAYIVKRKFDQRELLNTVKQIL